MERDADRTVAVLGLGTMGHGIAQTFALAGYAVRGFDEVPAARDSLLERVRANLRTLVEAGLLSPDKIAPTLARITTRDTIPLAVSDAQFVTEAIREDLPAKQDLFAGLESLVRADAILASNSSTFPISRSAARMQDRSRVIVTHWFNPPHLVPLVEVVPGPDTSPETTSATMAIMTRIGKRPLRLRKELPGFLVNRIQVALMREIWDLLEQGIASAEEIDEAIRGSVGFRLAAVGPLEVHDFGGLDIQATVFQNLAAEIRSSIDLPMIVRDLVAQGNYGAKTGRGFHDYSPQRLAERRERRDDLFLRLVKLLYPESVQASP